MLDHPEHSRRPRAVEYISKLAKREIDDLPIVVYAHSGRQADHSRSIPEKV